jgi:hypothetical protein
LFLLWEAAFPAFFFFSLLAFDIIFPFLRRFIQTRQYMPVFASILFFIVMFSSIKPKYSALPKLRYQDFPVPFYHTIQPNENNKEVPEIHFRRGVIA